MLRSVSQKKKGPTGPSHFLQSRKQHLRCPVQSKSLKHSSLQKMLGTSDPGPNGLGMKSLVSGLAGSDWLSETPGVNSSGVPSTEVWDNSSCPEKEIWRACLVELPSWALTADSSSGIALIRPDPDWGPPAPDSVKWPPKRLERRQNPLFWPPWKVPKPGWMNPGWWPLIPGLEKPWKTKPDWGKPTRACAQHRLWPLLQQRSSFPLLHREQELKMLKRPGKNLQQIGFFSMSKFDN